MIWPKVTIVVMKVVSFQIVKNAIVKMIEIIRQDQAPIQDQIVHSQIHVIIDQKIQEKRVICLSTLEHFQVC